MWQNLATGFTQTKLPLNEAQFCTSLFMKSMGFSTWERANQVRQGYRTGHSSWKFCLAKDWIKPKAWDPVSLPLLTQGQVVLPILTLSITLLSKLSHPYSTWERVALSDPGTAWAKILLAQKCSLWVRFFKGSNGSWFSKGVGHHAFGPCGRFSKSIWLYTYWEIQVKQRFSLSDSGS